MKNETVPHITNFVTSLRDAITSLGCSHKRVLDIVNAELGQMKLVKDGEATPGKLSISRPKNGEWKAKTSVKLGSAKFETRRITEHHEIAELHYKLSEVEKTLPSIGIVIPADSAIGKFILDKAKIEVKTEVKTEETAKTEEVTQ